MDCLIKFVIRLNILYVKKVVLQIVLIIILEGSKLIHMILYLLKNIDFSYNVTMLIKPVVNKNQNKNYCNIFLEKSFYKYKSNKRYM